MGEPPVPILDEPGNGLDPQGIRTLRVIAASGFAGALDAVLGAGIGAVLRNAGGAVTATVFIFIVVKQFVRRLRDRHVTWARIGEAVGTTRQSS